MEAAEDASFLQVAATMVTEEVAAAGYTCEYLQSERSTCFV